MKIKKPFDLEKAKNGAEVVTREGSTYRFLRVLRTRHERPLTGYYIDGNGNEILTSHLITGYHTDMVEHNHDLDLFILEEPKQVWTNVYKDNGKLYTKGNFATKEMAEEEYDDWLRLCYLGPVLLHKE